MVSFHSSRNPKTECLRYSEYSKCFQQASLRVKNKKITSTRYAAGSKCYSDTQWWTRGRRPGKTCAMDSCQKRPLSLQKQRVMPWALSYCQGTKRKNGGTSTIGSAWSWMAILFSFLGLESPWPGSARQAKTVVQVDLLQCSICWAPWAANCYQAASPHARGKQ